VGPAADDDLADGRSNLGAIAHPGSILGSDGGTPGKLVPDRAGRVPSRMIS
jgi:hypothetical protein